MGSNISQQGCLRLSKEQGLVEKEKLEINKEYQFEKPKHRLYMIDTPIELITEDWKAIARIIITEFTVGKNITKGKYKPIKIYTDDEVKTVSGTIVPYTNFR